MFIRLFLTLLLFAPLTAYAQNETADTRRPPLFVMADADSKVYLLGSVHLLPEGALPLPPVVEAAYADADVLAFELDLDAAQAGAATLMQLGMDGASIADVLTADQKAAFDAFAAGAGLPQGALDAFEPWMASMTLSVLAMQKAGMAGEGVDAHFSARAKADGKERVAFETAGQQIRLFDELPMDDQVAMLMAGIDEDVDSVGVYLARMIDLWSMGEDEVLAALMNEGIGETSTLRSALLTDRNRAWVPQIVSLLERQGEDALVVVGAGHLIGDESVVEMLRASGYSVERL